MTREELLRHARAGARARLSELQHEITGILSHFPELRRGGRITSLSPGTRVRTRTMSAAERKAVSERMKKRWEKWRKKHGKAGG